MEFIYDKIIELLKGDRKLALCTIVSTKGSSPLHIGSKMIVRDDGKIFGTIGGGNLEFAVIQNALRVIEESKPSLFQHDLKGDHQMCCGGQVEIFIEPVMKNKKLFIFGAGHIGKAIAKHASDLDMDIYVIDDREGIFNDWEFKGFTMRNAEYKEMFADLPFDKSTFIVIATYDHTTDREVLSFCIKQPHQYLGMIGSKNKVATAKKILLEKGISSMEDLNAVDMPIGLDISANTADEIAISIVAQMIKEKNKK